MRRKDCLGCVHYTLEVVHTKSCKLGTYPGPFPGKRCAQYEMKEARYADYNHEQYCADNNIKGQ